MKKIWFLTILSILFIMPVKADNITLAKSAKAAILIEASTGETIYKKNENEKLEPASMTKMMSMLLIIENIEKGVIKWTDKVTVSENASGMGGSQILLETNEKMSVKDLFKGVAIASGNDAVVALAEYIAGTEDNFVQMMNNKAKMLGLKNTNFKNPHGLSEANHYSSAYDMAMIAKELVKHEKVLKFTSTYDDYLREGTDRKLWLVNTNKLVKFYEGVDGLKTGHTSDAGFCITVTANKNGMRLIAVVMGENDSKTRNEEVSEMLDYGYAQYEVKNLINNGKNIGKYEVNKAHNKYADVIVDGQATILKKKIDKNVNATYDIKITNLEAPIKKGDKIGTIYIKRNNKIIRSLNLTVKQNIKKANILQLYYRYLKEIIKADINI